MFGKIDFYFILTYFVVVIPVCTPCPDKRTKSYEELDLYEIGLIRKTIDVDQNIGVYYEKDSVNLQLFKTLTTIKRPKSVEG